MQGVQVYFRTRIFTNSDKRSYFKFEGYLELTEPSINFRSNYAAMCVTAPNILASILHHAAAKGENCFPCLVNIFLLHRQRVLLLHQAYHSLLVEEEFRIRQRNQRWAILTFFSVK